MSKNRTETSTLASEPSEPPEPTDAELLKNFKSRFSGMDPNAWVGPGNAREPIHQKVERERKLFLEQQRAMLAQARAERERFRAEGQRKTNALERARAGEARARLKEAADAYQRWWNRQIELERELASCEQKLADLLAQQPAEADLAKLRARSVEIGDAQLITNALKSQLISWAIAKSEPLDVLSKAISEAQGELIVLHQSERGRRTQAAQAELETLIDPNQLRLIAPYNIAGLEVIAQAARSVLELDQAVGYSGGRYTWRYSVGEGELLAAIDRLTELQESLAPLLESV